MSTCLWGVCSMKISTLIYQLSSILTNGTDLDVAICLQGFYGDQVLKYFENCETDFDENGKEYVMINVDCGENQLKNAITNEVRSVW